MKVGEKDVVSLFMRSGEVGSAKPAVPQAPAGMTSVPVRGIPVVRIRRPLVPVVENDKLVRMFEPVIVDFR